MENLGKMEILSIEDLRKSQVKGYTRTRKGKMERVSPYARQFDLKEKRVNRAIAKMGKEEGFRPKPFGIPKPEPLANTDFELAGKKGKEIVLKDKETGVHELWGRSDNFAGYSIDVGGKGYEFLREVKDVTKLESMGVKIEKQETTKTAGDIVEVEIKGEPKLIEVSLSPGSEFLYNVQIWDKKTGLVDSGTTRNDNPKEWLREHGVKVESAGKTTSFKKPLGQPFSATTKQMEHEIHRMSTMTEPALMTRAGKITNIDKLIRFYAIAEGLNRPKLMGYIKDIGKDRFGLKDSDFEPMKAWEKKKSPKDISKKTGTTKGLLGTSVSQEDVSELKDLVATAKKEGWAKKGERKTLFKGEVKPFTRTRRGKFEQVKGFHRDVPFANKEIRGQVKEGRITDIAFKPSDTEKWKKEGKVLPIRGNKLIEDIKAGTSPYQKMSLAENYIIDVGGYGPRGEPYSTKGVQIQKLGGVDVKNIIKATHPTYKGRKVSVSTSIPSQLNSWWDEGHRTYYTFYELATGRTQGTGSNHPMFEASKPRYLSSLPRGVVIVARNYMGTKQSITIYANANDLEATSHPAGALDEAKKNFTGSPNPIPQSIKPEQFIGSPFSTKPSTPEEHKIKIAKDTLKMPQAMAGVMGGPTKAEARKTLGIPEPKPDELYADTGHSEYLNQPAFSIKEKTGPRAVYRIAQEIAKDWGKVNYAAKPYLDAMHALETIDTPYGADSGASVIAYFLANAQTWKGDKAREIKKELNAMLKKYYKKSMEDEMVDELMKAESRVKSHSRIVNGKLVNVREHQRYKLRRMLNFIRGHKEDGVTRGVTLRKLQDRFGLSTEMAHRVHRLAEGLGGLLFKPFPTK